MFDTKSILRAWTKITEQYYSQTLRFAFRSFVRSFHILEIKFCINSPRDLIQLFLMALKTLWALTAFQSPDLFTISRTP
jgi:hypothetical protein